MDRAKPPIISVVLRTKTSSNEVLELLQRIDRQTVRPFDVVVVDSGSSSEILAALRSSSEDGVPTTLIEIPAQSFTSAGALNRGCAEAKGSLIAILSQDALPLREDYLQVLSSAFTNAQVAAAYGRQVPRPNDHPLNVKDLTKTYGGECKTQTADCWLDNCCSMIRADLWRLHPFDEAAVFSEDHAWGKWAIGEGHAIEYVAEATVQHSHDRTLKWLWTRFYNEGRGLAFIHQQGLPLWKALTRMLREMASDCLWLIKRAELQHLWRPFIDRPVKHLALYAGYCRGRRG